MATPQDEFNPNDNDAYLVYIPSAVFVVICPVLMALRIFARLRGGKLGADDWTAVAALLFTLLTSGFLVASCQHGMGRHWATLNAGEKFESMKFFYMAQVTYKVAINLVKCSILLLYLKIFSQIRWFRWSCWGMLTVVALYLVSSVLATVFQCRPVSRAFDKGIDGTCIDNSKFWFANAGFSIATDVVILLLPMRPVFGLRIPWPQKAALVCVFALGIFVVITSCLRITSLDVLATTPDTTFDITNVMWTIIEPNVAVVCACLPILRPFVVKLFPALRSKGSSGNAYGLSGYGPRSRGAAESHAAERSNWVEIGAKPGGIHTSRVRSDSHAGSEESILGVPQPQACDGARIQKTVEYTVQYS